MRRREPPEAPVDRLARIVRERTANIAAARDEMQQAAGDVVLREFTLNGACPRCREPGLVPHHIRVGSTTSLVGRECRVCAHTWDEATRREQ
jgi:hypothetical protein